MSLTDAQQQAAHAPGSVAVMAGAGSGKTHMLVARYLHHLQTLSPLEIVATTFTEKAAAELRARIRRGVQASRPDDFETLAELEAAQISTIHALCARIVRDHPAAADVRPDVTILDEGQARVWRARHLRPALAELPDRLFTHVSFSRMAGLLPALLDDPLLAERALSVGRDRWETWATQARAQALDELTGAASWQAAVHVLQTCSGTPGDRMEAVRREALTHLAALTGEGLMAAVAGLLELKLTGGSPKAWPNGDLAQVKEAVKTLRGHLEAAQKTGLLTLTPSAADEWLAAALPDVREAFVAVRDTLTRLKRQAGLLDFAALEVRALQALQDPAVRAHYHGRWRAYLIDEAQDTNPVQAELLDLLSGGAQRTLVGDEKQSVYGFRRADPALFRAAGALIASSGGAAVSLDRSFRTHAALVDTANRVFATLLGPLHAPLTADRAGPPGPAVEAWHLEDTKPKARARMAEAAHLAARVRALLDEPTLIYDPHLRGERPVRPGDIAVLTRGWAALRPIGRALAEAGVPVHEAGGGSLLDTQEARDGLALLAATALHDPAALVAVLRSPLGGVNDAVIWDLARARGEDGDWFRALETSTAPPLERARHLMGELRRLCRQEPPSVLLQQADRLTGYTAVLANLWDAERRLADWRGLTELVRQLERGHDETFTVVQALREMIQADVVVPRPPLEAGDAVILTTMHSSKGLEWPVVLVADLNWSAPGESGDVLLDAELGVGLRQDETPTVAWTLMAARRRAREEAEARRLLYVALTRARDRLILSANGPAKPGTLLGLLAPGLQAAGVDLQEFAAPARDPARAVKADPPAAPLPAALWPDPVELHPVPGPAPVVAGLTDVLTDDWAEILDLLDPAWTAWAQALADCGVPAPSDVHVDLPVDGRVSGTSALMLWRRSAGDVLLLEGQAPSPLARALTVHLHDPPDLVARQLQDALQ
ncbi:UvrD-helicase domain-containing protein [Deinococcus arcticus]|uniref:UvrD-helicase domain-containing protein n=1 Tax=Deinococcus arcticus TaxID=2136176 RepID=UPI0011B213D3|nr:UvrD-helicase domain-containing protein [Deinococcus arcticus]